jgi:AcrR family transcriptional regulator
MSKRDRRAEIMDAAEKLFTSRHYHEITLDDVSQEAHVGKGTIYRYFEDKDDLLFEAASRGFDDLCELVTRTSGVQGPFAEQLVSMCRRISEFFQRRRQWLRMMQSEEGRMRWCSEDLQERWAQRRKKLVTAVAAILQRGVAEDKIRSDVPADLLANLLLGMLRVRDRYLGDTSEESRPLEVVVRLFCEGAGTAGANAREK